jgi:hypothetical protein
MYENLTNTYKDIRGHSKQNSMSLHPFCRENMDYILQDSKYDKRMYDIIKTGSVPTLLKLVEWKYFDKRHPENRNIKLTPESQENLNVFTSKGWRSCNKYDVIQRLYERIADDIDTFISEARSKNMNMDTKKFVKKIAQPLRFDMMNVETEDFNEEQEDIDYKLARQAIYEKTISLIMQNLNI